MDPNQQAAADYQAKMDELQRREEEALRRQQ